MKKKPGDRCGATVFRLLKDCRFFLRHYVILLIEIAIKSKRKTEVTIMEFKSILIKDTTVEERKQIVKESLGNISASCDGCMARLSEMYDEYIEGKKEIRDINMEFNGHYLRGDMDKGERRSCPM